MTLDPASILILLCVGLSAGIVGGMIGIGGSIIIIPAMVILFHDRPWDDQHLYQAAAMIVNVTVAVPATIRHFKARAIPMDLFRIMLPATAIAIVFGVLLSNQIGHSRLRALFAVFLLYIVFDTLRRIVARRADHEALSSRVTAPRGIFVGSVMGALSGLLGIGGGAIAVPLAHTVCRLPLRQCIAVSAAVMCLTAGVGAAIKVATLPRFGREPLEAIGLALVLAPTALLGGFIGAGLTHRLPIQTVRIFFAAVMFVAALRMGGII